MKTFFALALAALTFTAQAQEQQYPSKPIRLIVQVANIPQQ